jgi:hypothetical protein
MSANTQPQYFAGNMLPLSFAGSQIIVTDSVLLVVTTLWVAMRLYSRHIRNVNIQVEDWVIIGAMA